MSERAKPEPYVGVSGIAHLDDHIRIFDQLIAGDPIRLKEYGRFVMVGVQATQKTQVYEIENKYGRDWHPVGDEIFDAAGNEDSGYTEPFVHCFFDDIDGWIVGLNLVMNRTLHYTRGVQFNLMPWMQEEYRELLEAFRDRYPHTKIILQVHNSMLAEHSPAEIAQRLQEVPVDYALLDASGGKGVEMDPLALKPFIDEIHQRQLPVNVVIAGGLSGDNLEQVIGPLVQIFPDLSWDAEGRLRKGEARETVIDHDKVTNYLRASEMLLSSVRPRTDT